VNLQTSPAATVVFDGISITTTGAIAISAAEIGRLEVKNGVIDAAGAANAVRLNTSSSVEALIEEITFVAGRATRDVASQVTGSGVLDLELNAVSFGGTQHGLFVQAATSAVVELDVHDTDTIATPSGEVARITSTAGWAGSIDLRMMDNVWGDAVALNTGVTGIFQGSGQIRALIDGNDMTTGQRTVLRSKVAAPPRSRRRSRPWWRKTPRRCAPTGRTTRRPRSTHPRSRIPRIASPRPRPRRR
jgi:hypothetical protein